VCTCWKSVDAHAWLLLALLPSLVAAPGRRTPHTPNHYTDTLQGSKETTILLQNRKANTPMSGRLVKQEQWKRWCLGPSTEALGKGSLHPAAWLSPGKCRDSICKIMQSGEFLAGKWLAMPSVTRYQTFYNVSGVPTRSPRNDPQLPA